MLAKLHAHGKEIMEDHCIPLPKREIPEFIQIYEIIHYSLNRFKTLSRAKIRESESQYTEFKRMLEESNHALLHGDPKYQNMNGRYLLDLEGLTIGDESLDLAVILNDPKRILSEGHKKACLSLYYHFYCKEKGCQYREESLKELIMKVNAATFVRRLNSIAWNLLYIKEEGETAKEKLLYLSS
jgi:hypothetical protein